MKNLQGSALQSLNTNQKLKPKGARTWMDDLSHGVQATVIDLGLSRMDAGDGHNGVRVHWTPFDEEVFMGEGKAYSVLVVLHLPYDFLGDYQFDVYRMMRELIGDGWTEFHPFTNVIVSVTLTS